MAGVSQVLGHSVLVFSQSYLPICRVNIKRAIALLIAGKAEALDFTTHLAATVRSPSLILSVPVYIRLTFNAHERVWKLPRVTRREVLRRDRHCCQYCGNTKQLTLDHVIPRSKGGKHTWNNVVTACKACNNHKGDRTLQQAGMKLRTQPSAPIHPAITFAEEFWSQDTEHH